MTQRAERGLLVVGVGRSGTSLAMQALQRLGVGLSGDYLPPSERNARGAFEDVEVEKRMDEISARFGLREPYVRPGNWREDPLVGETERWLAEYLDRLAGRCGAPVLAVKYPLAGDVLPMWRDAFAKAGLRLGLIWATRNVRDNVASFPRAFGIDPGRAEKRYLIRCLHLMQDIPPEAFLLPYEGWTEAPQAQIRALADFVGAPLADEAAALHDLFDPSIDHGGQENAPTEFDPLTRAVDDAVRGLRGRADAHFGPELRPLRELPGRIAAAVAEVRIAARPPDQEAELRKRLAEKNRRIARLEAAAERQAGLAREVERATERAEAAAKRETELREAYAALTRASDADALARTDREAAVRTELLRLGERMKELEKGRKTAETLARKEADLAKRTAQERSAERKGFEAERKAAQKSLEAERKAAQKSLEAERKAAQAARKALKAEIARMRASTRWQASEMISRTFARPGWGVLTLPVRLVRLFRARRPAASKRGRSSAPDRPALPAG